jgi:hypothetical protein
VRETTRLQSQYNQIERQLRRDIRDGRGLTASEARDYHRDSRQLSRSIYRQKHDAQSYR